MTLIVVVMGVSGCGKSSVGAALAARLQLPFADADSFHSASNRAKMAAGQPLTDADRQPWLASLEELIRRAAAAAGPASSATPSTPLTVESDLTVGRKPGLVLACSALKRSYRDGFRRAAATTTTTTTTSTLSPSSPPTGNSSGSAQIRFILLEVDPTVLSVRLSARAGHFFPASLLGSQLATLEVPDPVQEPDARIVRLSADSNESIQEMVDRICALLPSE